MKERNTSAYETERVKVILSVNKSHRDRFYHLAQVFGVNGNELFSLFVDEMFYDPYSPTLPKRLEDSTARINRFFRKRHPEWANPEIYDNPLTKRSL